MYMQKTTAGFSPAITIKDSVHGQWDEYNVHDFPIDYFSFVDDSGKVYVGWTDNNDFYPRFCYTFSVRRTGIGIVT